MIAQELEVEERIDRDVRRALANVQADTLLRDVGRLERAWRRYERLYRPPMPGQLDLFAQTAEDRRT